MDLIQVGTETGISVVAKDVISENEPFHSSAQNPSTIWLLYLEDFWAPGSFLTSSDTQRVQRLVENVQGCALRRQFSEFLCSDKFSRWTFLPDFYTWMSIKFLSLVPCIDKLSLFSSASDSDSRLYRLTIQHSNKFCCMTDKKKIGNKDHNYFKLSTIPGY